MGDNGSMGLFVNRPEFDDELPGLPGEPLEPETIAERLPDAAPVGLGSLLDGGTVASIVIPVVTDVEVTEGPENT